MTVDFEALELSDGSVPLIDFVGPNTLPDHLFHPSGRKSGGLSTPLLSGGKSRFNRPNDFTSSGLNLEDLTDFAIHTQYDADQSVELLNQLHDRYILENMQGSMLRQKAYELWGLDLDMRPDLDQVNEEYSRSLFQAYQVYQQLLHNNMIGTLNNEMLENQRKISRVFEVLYLMRDYIMAEQRWVAMCDPTVEVRIPEEVMIFKFCPFDYSNNTAYQNLIIFLLQHAYIRGYRRFNEDCYEQIKTPEGYNTHAWKKLMSISEFINKVVQKESNYTMWQALTASGDVDRRLCNYLEKHDDVEFPKLEINRHVFAFRNGLFVLGNMKREKNSMVSELQMPAFYPYDTSPVPESIVACKYFDLQFNYEEYFKNGWYDIPTPAFESILDHQKLPRDAKEMMYIMVGRMLYNVGELDNWQVIPFVRGVANTGKSSILRVIYSLFNPENVGVMTSNMEKKFWASALYDKFIFLCYEARSEFSIPKGEFQTVISGEETNVPIKHKTAVSVVWTAPGFLAGNEIPNWLDAAGSMTRRLVMFEFLCKVTQSDPMLLHKLRQEIPALLCKINMAYLWAVEQHGKKPIWEWWGPYFEGTKNNLSSHISPLRSFMEDTDALIRHPDYYMPMSDFQADFYAYCESRKKRPPQWVETHYMPVFEDEGIAVMKHATLDYDGEPKKTTWLKGIGRREIWEKPLAAVADAPAAAPSESV